MSKNLQDHAAQLDQVNADHHAKVAELINDQEAMRQKMQAEIDEMGKEVETIKSKYDEDEFQAYFIENCEAAKKLSEICNAFE